MDFSAKAAIENVTVRYPAGLTANVGGVLYYDGDAKSQTLSGEVNVEYAYSLILRRDRRPVLALQVDDLDMAGRVLQQHGFELVGQD